MVDNQKIKASYRKTIFPFHSYNHIPAECGLEIHIKDNRVTVILTELPNNKGTSITNAIETLTTQVYRQYLEGIEPQTIQWIEHYSEQDNEPEHFDIVSLEFNTDCFVNPKWKRISIEEVLHAKL